MCSIHLICSLSFFFPPSLPSAQIHARSAVQPLPAGAQVENISTFQRGDGVKSYQANQSHTACSGTRCSSPRQPRKWKRKWLWLVSVEARLPRIRQKSQRGRRGLLVGADRPHAEHCGRVFVLFYHPGGTEPGSYQDTRVLSGGRK